MRKVTKKMFLMLLLFAPLTMAWQPEEEPFNPIVSRPFWSPSGQWIAFQGNLTEGEVGENIYIMSPDGTSLLKLTTNGIWWLFGWSPDGSKLYFSDYDENNMEHIYVMNIDGSGIQRVTPYPDEEAIFAISPTGEYMIIDGVLCSSTGEEIKLIPTGIYPSFSPDGKWVVSTDKSLEEESDLSWEGNLWIANVDTLERQRITWGQFNDFKPHWSPTGEWIVFQSDRPEHAPNYFGKGRIWLVRPNGQDLHPLFDYSQLPPDISDEDPSWSPDGNWIIFVRSSPDTGDDIWVASVDGSQVYRLTSFNYAALPGEKPSLFLAEFAKRCEGKTAANTPEKKGQVKEGKEISKKAQPAPDSKVAKSSVLKQEKPNDEKPPNTPAVPVAAGALSLSAVGYAIWKLLKLLT